MESLAEGFARLVLETPNGSTPVAYFRMALAEDLGVPEPACWPGCSPPARALVGPAAVPAPDAPLKVGERVWVQCPEAGVTGWAIMRATPPGLWEKGLRCVQMDSNHMDYNVLAAACHREGPKGPPPAEGATFLGRLTTKPGEGIFKTRRSEAFDAWWHNDGVNLGGGFATADTIDRGDACYVDTYRAALAVARELCLVDAEPAEAPEPEQKWKYVKGQWLEPTQGGWRAMPVVALGWSGVWNEPQYQFQLGCAWYGESELRPHAMTIDDVPKEVLLAIMGGKPVRLVDVPVNCDGKPIAKDRCDHLYRGEAILVRWVGYFDRNHCVVTTEVGQMWPWNLALVKE